MKINRVASRLQNASVFLSRLRSGGFFHLLSANFFAGIFSYLTLFVIAFFLPPASFGALRLVQASWAIALIFSTLGLNSAVARLCSSLNQESARDEVLAASLRMCVVSSLLSILGFVGISEFTGHSAEVPDAITWLAASSLPFSAAFLIITAYYQATGSFIVISVLTMKAKLIASIFAVVLTWFYGVAGYFAAFLLGALWPFATTTIRYKVREIATVRTRYPKSSLLPTAGWGLAANGAGVATSSIDIIYLGFIGTAADQLGAYGFATLGFTALNYLIGSSETFLLPRLAARALDSDAFQSAMRRVRLALFGAGGVIALSAAVVSGPVIESIFRGDALLCIEVFHFFLIKFFLISCYAADSVALFAKGKIKNTFYAAVIGFASMIASLPFLVGVFGVTGAAMSSVLASFVTLISVWAFRRKLYVNQR